MICPSVIFPRGTGLRSHLLRLRPRRAVVKIVTIELHGKKIILLSGARAASEIEAPEKLLDTARRNPDAVAFGYVSGQWVAAA